MGEHPGLYPDRIRTTRCWSCELWHSGDVWCPHCSAPVDPGSREAANSPWWQADPRREAMKVPPGDAQAMRRDQTLYGFSAMERGEDGLFHRVDPTTLSPSD